MRRLRPKPLRSVTLNDDYAGAVYSVQTSDHPAQAAQHEMSDHLHEFETDGVWNVRVEHCGTVYTFDVRQQHVKCPVCGVRLTEQEGLHAWTA